MELFKNRSGFLLPQFIYLLRGISLFPGLSFNGIQLTEIAANNKPQEKVKQPTLFDVIKNTEKPIGTENQHDHVNSEKAGIINELKDTLIQNNSSFNLPPSSIPTSIYEAVLPVILKQLENYKI
jgi:hypothetical protein